MFRIWCKGSLEFPREFTLGANDCIEILNSNTFKVRPAETAPANFQFLPKALGDGLYILAWDMQTSIWNEITFK